MATTEVVEIIIRERGAKATSASIRRVGRSSRTASVGVRALTTALAALGVGVSVRGLLEVADSAVRMNNQIRVVTKSTAEFNAVQLRLRKLSNDTRAPLDASVRIFRRLKIATRDLGTSTEDVLKVTEGLNAVIAISGATAQEGAAGLIQLAQALASNRLQGDELRSVLENLPPLAQALADQLREVGADRETVTTLGQVNKEIQETGEVSKVTIGRLRKLGEEGKLTAAVIFPALLEVSQEFIDKMKELPFTLDQARTVLSNTFTAVVDDIDQVLKGTTILSGGILSLAEALRETLVGGVIVAVEGFIFFAESIATVNKILNSLGVTVLPGVGNAFKIAGAVASISFSGLELIFVEILRASSELAVGVFKLAESLGLVDKEVVKIAQRGLGSALELEAETLQKVEEAAERLSTALREVVNETPTAETAKNFQRFADGAKELQAALEKLKSKKISIFDLTGLGEDLTGDEFNRDITAEGNALRSLQTLTDRLRIADIKRIEPLNAQLEKLKQQEEQAISLANTANKFEQSSEALFLIQSQILAIEKEKTDLAEEQENLFARISKLVEQTALFSPKLAEELQKAAIDAEETGGGLEKVVKALQKIDKEGAKGLADLRKEAGEFTQFFADELARGLGSAVSAALKGESFDAASFFADLVGKLVTKALQDSVEGLGEELAAAFRGAEGGEAGEGGFNFGAGIAAAFTAGAAVLTGALRDSTQDISNDLVRSAASQSEAAATRGVIAGPTSIPIFQVGVQLEAALSTTNEILLDILGAVQTAPLLAAGGGGGDTAANALETTTGSLT